MNPHFGNISSDSDQWVAAARLFVGHWRHPMHAHGEPVLCEVVIDVAEPRVVAAKVAEQGIARDADSRLIHTLNKALLAQEVHHHPAAWGFTRCTVLPAWARPSFSESQIEELERIQGYLIEASEDTVDSVLELRNAFLKEIGVTDQHMCRAVREGGRYLPKHGRSTRN